MGVGSMGSNYYNLHIIIYILYLHIVFTLSYPVCFCIAGADGAGPFLCSWVPLLLLTVVLNMC